MAKSALCIGIVSVLATGASGGGDLPATLGSTGRDAADRLVKACVASPDCLHLGARAVSAAADQGGDMPDAVARVVIAASAVARSDETAVVPPLPYGTAAAPPLPPERPLRRGIVSRR